MKTKTTLLFLLICAFINAQSVESITISSGGEFQNNGTNSLNATIGEAIIGTITNSETIHQGFWASAFALELLDISGPVELNNSLFIYPNPAKDILYIETQFVKDFVFTIYTVEGKKVLEEARGNGELLNKISLASLPSGLYILQIKDETSSVLKSVKLLKQ